jgi:hypothetical protein
MYLRIDEDGDLAVTKKEPEENDFQVIENEEVRFIRWNATLQTFEIFVAESSSDDETPDDITWETCWARL